jgi:hypothetical protein
MNYNSFRKLMKNRYALSTVVTTLIILVISVLLASVVTYFAINVVSTRVQEESLSLSDAHIYLWPGQAPGSPTYSQGTLKVINTGGRDVVITKIAVRGQDNAWSSWTAAQGAGNPTDPQFIMYSITKNPVETDMYFQPETTGANPAPILAIPAADPAVTPATPIDVHLDPTQTGGTSYPFSYATTDLVLQSGCTMLLYITNPDSVTINDVGLTVSITLYTAQAMYYEECNVQAYAPPAA